MEGNIYEILEEHRQLEQMLYESGGEITPEIEERLAINADNFKDKMEQYGKIVRENELYISNVNNEIDRMRELVVKRVNVIERLKERMLESLRQYGGQDKRGVWKLDTGLFRFSTRKSSSIVIENETNIPEDCYVVPPPKEPYVSKELIREHLTKGETIDGVLIQENYSIQIR